MQKQASDSLRRLRTLFRPTLFPVAFRAIVLIIGMPLFAVELSTSATQESNRRPSPSPDEVSPEHPMTRSDSRRWKMESLRYVSNDLKLVCGCETGHDAAVPFVDYFEGMLSLGPYRVPEAGRDMQRIWTEVPERVAKFQLGDRYRLPLWELVFHDCVVAQWYWGDYNNKLPELWEKRDLFNLLYGTPPMFMFNRQIWKKEKDRFAQSYRDTCTVARAVGYAEMTDHRFLTPNRDVQQTIFDNGVRVTANFGLDDIGWLNERGFVIEKPTLASSQLAFPVL